MKTLDEKNIESLAQYLCDMHGYPEDKIDAFWMEAERQLQEMIFQKDAAFSEEVTC